MNLLQLVQVRFILPFNGEISAILNGSTTSHIPSTIVKISDKIELVRAGSIPFENIKVWEETKIELVHGGFRYKEAVKKHLEDQNITVIDVGPVDESRVDYPSYGIAVGEQVRDKKADLGVVVCTSGEGITIAANKVHGVRGIGYDDKCPSFTGT